MDILFHDAPKNNFPLNSSFLCVPPAPVRSDGIYQANITIQAKNLQVGAAVVLSTTGSAILSSVTDHGDGIGPGGQQLG